MFSTATIMIAVCGVREKERERESVCEADDTANLLGYIISSDSRVTVLDTCIGRVSQKTI